MSSPSKSAAMRPLRNTTTRVATRTSSSVSVEATITVPLKWEWSMPRLAAPLKGGAAVLVGKLAAYWVHEGTVYAANGVAMSWSPGCQWSPAGVGFAEIQAALDVQL